MTEPSKIPVPFAEAGTKNEIPQTTEERGRASWGTGFPAETSIPVTEGGVAPKRADFNGLFHALSAAEQWEQQGNLWSYDNSVDYQPNAIVTYNGEIYLCAAANGPSTAVKSPLETAFWTALTSGGRLNTAALAQGTANISISGSSASAVADGEGNNIHDTYMPKSGGNFTGDVTVKGESILTQSGGTIFGDLDVRGTTTSKELTSGAIVDGTGVINEVRVVLDNAVTDGTSSGEDDSVFKVSVKGHDLKIGGKTAETVFEVTPNMGVYINGSKVATIASNVASATKLATARNINGVAFDGTKDISVKDDTKLSLSGGTMTGEIHSSYQTVVVQNIPNVSINDTSRLSTTYTRPFSVYDKDGKRGVAFELVWNSNGSRSANFSMGGRDDVADRTAGLTETKEGYTYFHCNNSQVLLPVGAVFAFAANSSPSGCLLCNGAAVSRKTYAALFAAIGTTYGAGDGSNTFNLPNLTDRFIQGSGTAGTYKAAGAPNITGYLNISRLGVNPSQSSGAFSYGAISAGDFEWPQGGSGAGNINIPTIWFNASSSNSIYGNSDTIQPPALTMRYYIKY